MHQLRNVYSSEVTNNDSFNVYFKILPKKTSQAVSSCGLMWPLDVEGSYTVYSNGCATRNYSILAQFSRMNCCRVCPMCPFEVLPASRIRRCLVGHRGQVTDMNDSYLAHKVKARDQLESVCLWNHAIGFTGFCDHTAHIHGSTAHKSGPSLSTKHLSGINLRSSRALL